MTRKEQRIDQVSAIIAHRLALGPYGIEEAERDNAEGWGILGDSDFVRTVLTLDEDELYKSYFRALCLEAKSLGYDWIEKAAQRLGWTSRSITYKRDGDRPVKRSDILALRAVLDELTAPTGANR